MPKTHREDVKSSRETGSVHFDGYWDMHAREKKEVEKNEADIEEIGLPLGWEGVEPVT